jgi:hypothetical protein
MRLDISVVDRHDVEASAWKADGWIEVRIKNVVGIPVPVLQADETLLLLITPEKREPVSERDKRGKLLEDAARKIRNRYIE